MHFSKIYIQDNFVPDYATDPYRRKVIGIEVTVNEGENLCEARGIAEDYIEMYIRENKVESPHIVEKYIPEPTVLPSIQVEKEERLSLEDQIKNCVQLTGPDGLFTYKTIATMSPVLSQIYESKLKQLQHEYRDK